MQGGDEPRQRGQRIGHRPAEHPRVHRALEDRDLHVHVDDAAQAGRQGRDLGAPVLRVGDDHHVGGQEVLVLAQQPFEGGGAELLLALDEELHAHGRLPAVGAQRGDVRHHSGLVVGDAAAVQPPVLLDDGERVGLLPLREVADRLHVLVGVQQHRRLARGGGEVRVHARLPAAVGELAGLGRAGLLEEALDGVRALADRLVVESFEGDRRDLDEGLQVGAHRGHGGAHRIHYIAHEAQV
jgi:hypothetical protein